jgi:aminoglycoside phosphotransferase (APT) family kinase protein
MTVMSTKAGPAGFDADGGSEAGRTGRPPIRHRLTRRIRLLGVRWRARGDRRLLSAALAAAGLGDGSSGPVDVVRRTTTRGGLGLTVIQTRDGERLVKIASTASGRLAVRRDARVLRAVHHDSRLAAFGSLVPEPLAAGQVDGRAFAIQTCLPGVPASDLPAEHRRAMTAVLAGTIGGLHAATTRPVDLDDALIDRWVIRRVALVRRLLQGAPAGTGHVAVLAELEHELRADLVGRTADCGWIHGDYWAGNVLVSSAGEVCGIVDWDSAAARELPLNDVFHLVVSDVRLRQGMAWGIALVDVLAGRSLSADERALIENASASAGLPIRSSVVLYWLRTIESSHRRHPATVESRPWTRANVTPVVEAAPRVGR